MGLPYDSASPFLQIYLEKPNTMIQRNICILMFIVVLFSQGWEAVNCLSVDEWIKDVVHLDNGILLGSKKPKPNKQKHMEILPTATAWMDLESIMLNEISHSEKNNYHMISLICGV